MSTEVKRQTAKVGVAGSFFNQMMSNNSSLPEVGKGATEMHYSDRSCYEVIEVSPDGKTVKLEFLDAEWDKTQPGGQGHQNWILKPTGRFRTVVWRHNAWRVKGKEIGFIPSFYEDKQKEQGKQFVKWTEEEQKELFVDGRLTVVDGKTKAITTYSKIRILFGTKEYYYDWEF